MSLRRPYPLFLILSLALASGLAAHASPSPSPEASPRSSEERAVAYLTVEVPRWYNENSCHSCHNNGDAVVALMSAARRGMGSGNAMDETLAWMKAPETWGKEHLQDDFYRLQRIRFASTVVSMMDEGKSDRATLERAAALMLSDQSADGSWQLSWNGRVFSQKNPNVSPNLGSPGGLGTTMATATARLVLARTSSQQFQPALAKANAWLRARDVSNVMDASAILLGLDRDNDAQAVAQRQRCLTILKAAQKSDGSWGPTADAAPQSFDAALAIVVLSNLQKDSKLTEPAYSSGDLSAAIANARHYLVTQQGEDGSWDADSRPNSKKSYARRISTTAWALRALLVSEP